MKYILYIGIFLLITLISCNKNEKIKINPDLLNCCFKKNTYWVYIDSLSNNIDSIYVSTKDHYYNELYFTDYTTYDVEYYTFVTGSSPSGESTNFKVTRNYLDKIDPETHAHTAIYVDYNEVVEGAGYTFEHLDSTFIYDRYYYRVLKVEVEEDVTEDNNKSIYFINSDYGILRHDIYSDTILISSKVLMRKKIRR